MKKYVPPVILALLCLLPRPEAFSGGYRQDFDSPGSLDDWTALRGHWKLSPEEGKYVQTMNDGNYAFSISPFKITDGFIEIKATATEGNRPTGGGCFGVMVKYIDSRNWIALRYGAYGTVNFVGRVDGEQKLMSTGYRFRPEIGRAYVARMMLRGDRMMILLDGEVAATVDEIPFSGAEGRTGLFALSAADFEYFEASAGF